MFQVKRNRVAEAVYLACLALVMLMLMTDAEAQTLNFTANTTTGASSVTPVFTWSTVPAATTCTASGDPAWTGTKPPAGSATLPAINVSKTYSLSCVFPGDSTARLTWVAPTSNTNGSALAKCTAPTDTGPCLAGFRVNYGSSAAVKSNVQQVANPNATTANVTGLAVGTHYFDVEAYTGQGVESAPSLTVSKVISATSTTTRNIAITVNPEPNSPGNVIVE